MNIKNLFLSFLEEQIIAFVFPVFTQINTTKIMICFWQNPILRTYRCSLWFNAIALKFSRHILNTTEQLSLKSLINDTSCQSTPSRSPRQPCYLIYQPLKITKVPRHILMIRDTAKFLYRRPKTWRTSANLLKKISSGIRSTALQYLVVAIATTR